MVKYRRNEEEDNGLSYSEELALEQKSSPEEDNANSSEKSYEKRYGDLRRHSHQQLQQKDQEISVMRDQLDQAAKGQIKFPKTDEEVDEWSSKYPDVAKIVDTIAQKRASEALEEGEKRMAGLKKLETKLTRQEAEQQLIKSHPDFSDIRKDPAFHEWVAIQPQNIQDSLYKNNTDARAASRAIDLYKSDTGKRNIRSKSAAQAVGRTSTSTPSTNHKSDFTESQIEAMSDHEFAKHADAIEEARQKGKILFDITGAAR